MSQGLLEEKGILAHGNKKENISSFKDINNSGVIVFGCILLCTLSSKKQERKSIQ